MNIDIYLDDGKVISSIGISGATNEEALTAIRAFGFGENKEKELDTRRSIGRQLLELQEERDEWKEKYVIECQHNDEIKMANDVLTKNFEALAKDRDAWKEMYKLESQRNEEIKMTYDKLTKENDQLKAQYKSCLENNYILEDAVNEWKEKYAIECQNNDDIKKAYDKLSKDFNTLFRDRDEWRDKSNMLEKCYKSASLRCVELIKERDEYKEIASDRDDLKIALDQANDYVTAVEKSRDQLISDCETLRNELNKYKEIASDRDDLKVQLDDANLTIENLRVNRDEWYNSYTDEEKLCATLRKEKDELEKRFKLVREDYFDMQHQLYKLMVENEKLKKDREDYTCQLKKSES